jgi:putative transposase
MARSGGGWRMLPKHFLPWQTVYWWFRHFVRRFMFRTIHNVVLMIDRERTGHEASPTGGIINSKSVKAPEAKTRGYDAGKDNDGRFLMVLLTPARCLRQCRSADDPLYPSQTPALAHKYQFADGAYDRTKLMDKAVFLDFTIDVVKRSDSAQGFEILPRRWVVERTFGLDTRWRRLVRDYEERIEVSEATIHIALSGILLGRIAHD